MTKVRLNKPLTTTNINGFMPSLKRKSYFFSTSTPKKAWVCVKRGENQHKKRTYKFQET